MNEFQKFYQRTRTRFFNYLLRMTNDTDLAGDIFQESYARYWERYARREPSAGLLFTIGRNAFFDHCRNRKHTMCYEDRCEDKQPDQETVLIGKESCQRVLAAMSALPPLEREVMSLAIDGGFTYTEIARITDLSVGNIKVKVHRARQKLRRLLED